MGRGAGKTNPYSHCITSRLRLKAPPGRIIHALPMCFYHGDVGRVDVHRFAGSVRRGKPDMDIRMKSQAAKGLLGKGEARVARNSRGFRRMLGMSEV